MHDVVTTLNGKSLYSEYARYEQHNNLVLVFLYVNPHVFALRFCSMRLPQACLHPQERVYVVRTCPALYGYARGVYVSVGTFPGKRMLPYRVPITKK